MTDTLVDVHTEPDGTLVLKPHGTLDDAHAVHFRQVLIHAVRRTRPPRLILDLSEVPDMDPINLGTLAALCDLADDHHLTVHLDNPTPSLSHRLQAAGVPRRRLRTHIPFPALT